MCRWGRKYFLPKGLASVPLGRRDLGIPQITARDLWPIAGRGNPAADQFLPHFKGQAWS